MTPFDPPPNPHAVPDEGSRPIAGAGPSDSPRRRPGRLVLAVAVALALAGGAAVGLQRLHAEAPATVNGPAVPPAMPVSVAAVVAAEVAPASEFSGRLEAVERVDVRPRVAGTIKAVHFREGALVAKGELLFTIDPEPFAAEVERAEAQLAAASARAAFARSEHDRAQRLLADRAIARREADERANARGEADAHLRAARAAVQSARLNLGYTRIVAPVAGRVGRLAVTAGNLVAAGPGAPVLTTLVSTSPIYASFDADEQIVGRTLRELRGAGAVGASIRDDGASGRGDGANGRGDGANGRGDGIADLGRVAVRMGTAADNGLPHEGRLQLIDNQVDARSGTVRVRAVFDNADGSLMPGQFARLRMAAVQAEPAVLIAERAIGTDQSRRFVMVVGDDDTARYREVTLGAAVNGLRVVASGLKPGERIVVGGLQRVRPGAKLAPEVVPMTVASAAN